MVNTVRSMDILGRYGGDEFLVILPETDSFAAVHIAERLRGDIDKAGMGDIDPRMSGKITVSIGIACFPAHGTTSHVLIEHADEALYAAKARGKNRIVVY